MILEPIDEVLAHFEMNRLLDLKSFPLQIVHQSKVDRRPISQQNRIRFFIFSCLRPEVYRRKGDEDL